MRRQQRDLAEHWGASPAGLPSEGTSAAQHAGRLRPPNPLLPPIPPATAESRTT